MLVDEMAVINQASTIVRMEDPHFAMLSLVMSEKPCIYTALIFINIHVTTDITLFIAELKLELGYLP
jgi:hypothetical protein